MADNISFVTVNDVANLLISPEESAETAGGTNFNRSLLPLSIRSDQ